MLWDEREFIRREMGPTSSATASLLRCSGRELLWLRSESSCGIGTPRPRLSMPRLILFLCGHWPCLGPGVLDEHAAQGHPRLPRDASKSGIQTTRCSDRSTEVRLIPRKTQRISHYDRASHAMGAGKSFGTSLRMGSSAWFRAGICAPLECDRSAN